MNKRYGIALLVGTLIVLGAFACTRQPQLPGGNGGQTSTTTPVVTPTSTWPFSFASSSTTSLEGLDLRKPLPVSYKLFKHPKTYVSEHLGFAFDYEDGALKPLTPTVFVHEGIPADEGVSYPGYIYADGVKTYTSLGQLKFTFLPSPKTTTYIGKVPQNNLVLVNVGACVYNNFDYCKSDLKQNYYEGILPVNNVSLAILKPTTSLLVMHGLGWRAIIYSPSKQYQFVTGIDTNSPEQDKRFIEMAQKITTTFRELPSK